MSSIFIKKGAAEKNTAYDLALFSKDQRMVKSRQAIIDYAAEYMAINGWKTADLKIGQNRSKVVTAVVNRMKATDTPFMPVKANPKAPYFDGAEANPFEWVDYVIAKSNVKPSTSPTHTGPIFENVPVWQAPLVPLARLWDWWSRFPPRTQLKFAGFVIFLIFVYLMVK